MMQAERRTIAGRCGVCCIAAALMLLAVAAHTADAGDSVRKTPDAAGRQAEIVPVSYVTLRNRTGSSNPAGYYGGRRGRLGAGVCEVAFSPIQGLEGLAATIPFYIPDEKIELAAVHERKTDVFVREISSFARQGRGDVVLYVHGYNVDFEKGCKRSAIFQRALGLHDRLLLFSWPADGNMLKYTWDESDLVWSVPHLAEFLREIVKQAGSGKIDLVAHSLGARGMVQALVRMATPPPEVPVFKELVLIAPDIDTDIFKEELPVLRPMVERITVYQSENDKALRLSNEVHGYPRLGEAGELLTVLSGVETIDISDVTTRRFSGHLYHLFNQEVIADLTLLLDQGVPAAQRPSLKRLSREGLPYWRLQPGEQ